MPHNPSSLTAWVTPQQYNSGEVATSTNYNNLVNDVGLLYAKPWATVTATVATAPANGAALFVTGQSPATLANSPASAAGNITFGVVNTSYYGFTVPLTGMYRITMCVSLPAEATAATYGMEAIGYGGATANNWQYSTRTASSTAVATSAQFSFIAPMAATGTTGSYPTQVYFTMLTTATDTISVSTPPSYVNGTFAQIEYLGTSTGSI
jgi:hypothetical protein